METPISKSQTRAMNLLNLAPVTTYDAAGSALETAGYRRDAIPVGSNWRQAAKLSDVDLIAAIALPADRFEDTSIDRY
jgi:hypothetical protein